MAPEDPESEHTLPCSDGPLHLLVDSTIKVEGEGTWNACKHGGTKRRVLRRSTSALMRNPWKSGPPRPPASSAMRRCCPSCSTRSRPTRRSQPSPPMVPSTPASVTTPSPPEGPPRSSRPARTPSPESLTPPVPSHETKSCGRRNASVEPSGDPSGDVERIPPPESHRNQDALRQAAGAAAIRQRLRPSGRRVPGPGRGPEPLHRARNARHRGRGISLFEDGEAPAISRLVQQSHARRTN